jgi:predicted PolB exonuclease-like 3'-5' exonuclease
MFFVFDVETIPDFEFVRNVIKNPEENDDDLLIQASEELARNKSGFLPPMYHKMISWVGLWIENNGVPKQKASWHGTDEKKGLKSLFDVLSTYKDFGLVHHNGRGFDLPLLTYRSLKHGIQMPKRLNHYDIKYRYSDDNVDLLDEFSNYGASSWPKLKHLGHLIGIPFKQTGEGNEVLKMFREDKLEEIEHYCYEDVMGTYVVWLHLKYTVGDIDQDLFGNLKDRAMTKLSEIQKDVES